MIYIRKASRFKAFLPAVLGELIKVIMLYIVDVCCYGSI